jgi:hypothetical protein
MDTQAIRQAWMESELAEQPVKIDLPGLAGANLIIRELTFGEGADLIALCSDQKSKTMDQKKLMGLVLLATLRNADDPDKALIFSEADRDFILSKSMNAALTAANASLKLSGLQEKAADESKNVSTPKQKSSTVVEGSATVLPTN